MLLTALVLGALTAYYFGLRAGYWAAGVTFALCLARLFVPRLALVVDLVIAGGAIVIWRIGSRRQRPADAVMATRVVRRAVGRAWARLSGRDRQR
jgi:hypothetical protein